MKTEITKAQKKALAVIGVLGVLAFIGKFTEPTERAQPKAIAYTQPLTATQAETIEMAIPELEPEKWYQVSAVTLLLSSPTKDEAVQSAALKIPRGGYFKAISRHDRFYYVNVNDSDVVRAGYLDGDHLAMQDVKPVAVAPNVQPEALPLPTPLTVHAVYIAPYSGKKYHSKQDCRGLRSAREVISIDEATARIQGYTECGICR